MENKEIDKKEVENWRNGILTKKKKKVETGKIEQGKQRS